MVFNPQAVSRQRYVVPPRRHLRQWRDRGIARVMLARRYPEHAATLLARRERLTERLVWRWLRRPLAEVVLAAVAAGAQGPRSVRWFRQARDLELFAGIRAAGGVPEQRPVRVLCYHAISDLHGAGVLEPFGVPPRRFRRQLRLLARFFNFIDAREFAQFLRGSGVPRRAVLLTFDDCYGDLLDAGLPALREAHAPALAFAVTGLLGGTNDWDAHHGGAPLRLLSADGLRELERAGVAIGEGVIVSRMEAEGVSGAAAVAG